MKFRLKPVAFLGTGLLAAALVATAPVTTGAEDKKEPKIFSGKQKDEIRRIIRDYLVKNPEVLVEAMQALRAKQRRLADERAREAIAKHRAALVEDKDSVIGGNPEGNITVVEFFDYRCPYCKRAKRELDSVLKADGNIRVVFKEYPILGEMSVLASRAAIAARKQGDKLYVKFHDELMEMREMNPDTIMAAAKKVGLDIEKLQKDMADPKILMIINRNRELAEQLGIRGTPAFVIGNQLVRGMEPAASLAARVARARALCKRNNTKKC